MADHDKYLALKKLITDEDFDKLQNLSTNSNLNIFKITGMNLQEIKHSNTIAWFLDPFENHNLRLLFFQKFVTQLFEENPDYFNDQGINIVKLLLNDFEDAKVVRESEANIDILFKSKNDEFLLCIENKIHAGLSNTKEDKSQLDKYFDYIKNSEEYSHYKRIFVLLSPQDEIPSEKLKKAESWKSWILASYENIVEIFRSILNSNIDLKMQYIIRDYIEFLEKEHIVENNELNAIRENLYKNHKGTIEFLVENRKNNELDDILAKLYIKHKVAIDFLAEYEDPTFKHIQKVFVETLKELDKEKKIICKPASLNSFNLVFHTQNMNKHFPRIEDKSGSWKDGSKYIYWIPLDPKNPKPNIIFDLGPWEQDEDTIKKFNKILDFVKKRKVTTNNKYRHAKVWRLGIDWYDEKIEDEFIRNRIIEAYKEIVKFEEELEKELKS